MSANRSDIFKGIEKTSNAKDFLEYIESNQIEMSTLNEVNDQGRHPIDEAMFAGKVEIMNEIAKLMIKYKKHNMYGCHSALLHLLSQNPSKLPDSLENIINNLYSAAGSWDSDYALEGKYALHIAIDKDYDPSIIQQLCRAEKADRREYKGMIAAEYASNTGKWKYVPYLMTKYDNYFAGRTLGRNDYQTHADIFLNALIQKNKEFIDRYLSDDTALAEFKSGNRAYWLHQAIQSDLPDVLIKFLGIGIDLKQINKDKKTALEYACELKRWACVEVMIEHLKMKTSSATDEQVKQFHLPEALKQVVKIKNYYYAEIFLEYGKKYFSSKNFDSFATLTEAVKQNDIKILKLLLVNYKLNVAPKDGTESSILVTEAVKVLVKETVENRNLDTLKLLLDRKASVNLNDGSKSPALLEAVKNNDMNIVTLLLQNGATCKEHGVEGNKVLYHAVQNDNPAMITLLLKNGADPDKKNKDGKTMEEFASGKINCVDAIVQWKNELAAKILNSKLQYLTQLHAEIYTQKFYKKKSGIIETLRGDYIEYEPAYISKIKEKMNWLMKDANEDNIVDTFNEVHLALINENKNKTSDHTATNKWIENKKTLADKIKSGNNMPADPTTSVVTSAISSGNYLPMPLPSAPLMTNPAMSDNSNEMEHNWTVVQHSVTPNPYDVNTYYNSMTTPPGLSPLFPNDLIMTNRTTANSSPTHSSSMPANTPFEPLDQPNLPLSQPVLLPVYPDTFSTQSSQLLFSSTTPATSAPPSFQTQQNDQSTAKMTGILGVDLSTCTEEQRKYIESTFRILGLKPVYLPEQQLAMENKESVNSNKNLPTKF